MLEEAEDRAARAAVEGRQKRAGGKVISYLPTPYNDNVPCGWIALEGFVDPPETPPGYKVELKRDTFMGFVTAYRFVPVAQRPALVIIESPYGGDVERNKAYARSCLLDSLRRGEAPIVSHLLHTQVLDDRNKFEHKWGIEAGLAWYHVAEKCVVYSDRGISGGMIEGIDRAKRFGVLVEFRNIEASAAA
ncbi:hypothetical protein [Brucella cytisi]|nr:hypothetical protein [Brucella cytisi]